MDICTEMSQFIVKKAVDCSFPLTLSSAASKTNSEQCSNCDDGNNIMSSILNDCHTRRKTRGGTVNGHDDGYISNNETESDSIQIDLYSSGIFCSLLSLSRSLCNHLKVFSHEKSDCINKLQQINHHKEKNEILNRNNLDNITASIGTNTFQLQSRILLLTNCNLRGNGQKNTDTFAAIERGAETLDANTPGNILSNSQINKYDDDTNFESKTWKRDDAYEIVVTHEKNSLILPEKNSNNLDSEIMEKNETTEKNSLSYKKLKSTLDSGCFLKNALEDNRRITERMICKWAFQIMSTINDSHLHYISLGPLDISDVILISDYLVLKNLKNDRIDIRNEKKKEDDIEGSGVNAVETSMVSPPIDSPIPLPLTGKDSMKNHEIDIENDEIRKKSNDTNQLNLDLNKQHEMIQNKSILSEGEDSLDPIDSDRDREFSSSDKEGFSRDKEIFSRDAWLNPTRWLAGKAIGIFVFI